MTSITIIAVSFLVRFVFWRDSEWYDYLGTATMALVFHYFISK